MIPQRTSQVTEPEATAAVDRYLDQAATGDGRACVRQALDLVDGGVPADDVIVGLLGAAQREVGERWMRNQWTVADEHLTSGVTQKALDAVAHLAEPAAEGGRVVVACAEGDWHSLPAQMFAEMLRARGFAVAFLGASTPAEHVSALLARHPPDALAVSCNLPLYFAGVTRLADAAHRQGIPVIAGGRALGTGPQRATRLGADGWASAVDDAVAILHGWQSEPPELSPAPTALDPVAVQLEALAQAIGGEAFETLLALYPPMAAYDERQMARTREDLVFITQYVAAARMVGDPSVLTEMLDWLRTLLTSRGIPAAAVDAGLRVLAPIIARTDPVGAQLASNAISPDVVS